MLNKQEFDKVFAIMEEAFPEVEYRSYDDQYNLLSNPYYRIKTIARGDDILGFIAYWSLNSCCFGEHLAITPALRGKGMGVELLNSVMSETDKPFILEVELPETEIAKRRIGFYQRLGLHYNTFPYLQQPLRKESSTYPLAIMSYPGAMSATKFLPFKKEIYLEVYGVSKI